MKQKIAFLALGALCVTASPATAASVDANLEVMNEVAAAISKALVDSGYKGYTTVTAARAATGLPWAITNFRYGEPVNGTRKPLSAEVIPTVNCSTQPQQAVVQFNRTITEGASWTVTNGVHVGTTLSVTAELPGAEVGASVSLDFSTETSSSTSSQVDYGFSYSANVNVSPQSKSEGRLIVSTIPVSVPWSATITLDTTKVQGVNLFPYLNTSDFFQKTQVLGLMHSRTLAEILGKRELTFNIAGTYQSVDASTGSVVWGAESPVTAQDCGGVSSSGGGVAMHSRATNEVLTAQPQGRTQAIKASSVHPKR